MNQEKHHYNKGEDLEHCAICGKQFIEGDPVSVIEFKDGPFSIVHKECYNLISLLKGENSKQDCVEHKDEKMLTDDDKLWRYMDLAKFISMMKSESLYFASPKCFDDIFEGAHGELRNKKVWDDFYMSHARAIITTAPDNCWHKIEKERLEENAQRLVKDISTCGKQGIYISCWHHNEFESEAMWKMYSVNVQNAIAIQTTYGKLKQCLGKDAMIKNVRYVDYANVFIGPNDNYWCKRKSFEYEHEVRAIIHDFHGKREGIEYKVDLSNLIENIFISPYAPKWFHELVADLIDKYEFNFCVAKSSMDEEPF